MTLADRFATIEELLASNDNELNKLGITNQIDRTRLMKQAQLLNDKTNQSLTLKRRSIIGNRVIENCIDNKQTTRLNSNILSKSTCNLSPAMLSRISFNDRPTSVIYPYVETINDIRKHNFNHLIESEEKILIVDDNGKIQTKLASSTFEYQDVLKKIPSTSIHGMRTIKSLSAFPALEQIRHGKVEVGLRPYRDNGVRLEHEKTADGIDVVHCYGHSGGGVTLSWGCAKDVVDIVKTLLPPNPKRQNNTKDNLPEHEQLWRLIPNFEDVILRAKI
ncbi:unnamed protein product [Rotaria sp. Silwood1]|nr:unnamed protein product [Rotaria sp. Silwood1]